MKAIHLAFAASILIAPCAPLIPAAAAPTAHHDAAPALVLTETAGLNLTTSYDHAATAQLAFVAMPKCYDPMCSCCNGWIDLFSKE